VRYPCRDVEVSGSGFGIRISGLGPTHGRVRETGGGFEGTTLVLGVGGRDSGKGSHGMARGILAAHTEMERETGREG